MGTSPREEIGTWDSCRNKFQNETQISEGFSTVAFVKGTLRRLSLELKVKGTFCSPIIPPAGSASQCMIRFPSPQTFKAATGSPSEDVGSAASTAAP
eukprot:CAMPEP_0184318334 /NCGR_PEP_ID=MMETSP1049-20130417/102007_1 /TAXON_ID=77928 /ORGANISM="Proteomonas sulcata, Strain CCMP704" /LENGTH=96 /DNA_ID=CAMNT_0026638071 /DNA_START=108 /DNA_END=395 /DNA_ORIENTATION=+